MLSEDARTKGFSRAFPTPNPALNDFYTRFFESQRYYGSSCANNGKGALNIPDQPTNNITSYCGSSCANNGKGPVHSTSQINRQICCVIRDCDFPVFVCNACKSRLAILGS
eukprot:733588-Pyramimonas_sp.AAC.1